MTTFLESLQRFLPNSGNEFNSDLIERFLAAGNAEVQVNIRTDLGQCEDVDSQVRTDESFSFYNIRYPKSAGTTPDWSDRNQSFPIEVYYQCIGATGFSANGSCWVGFDIDTIVGHSVGHGVSDTQIERIDCALRDIPYIELRRSTRGLGRHVYVQLSGFDTKNHDEHAAVGRAVLGKLCLDAGFDFSPSVDGCGGNMWFMSLDATSDNRGFECLKVATRSLTIDDVPNWREHVDIVRRKHTKVRLGGIDEEFASSCSSVKKDLEHDRILNDYRELGYSLIWQPDHGCYQLHTAGLAETHRRLGLKGAFATSSEGNNPGQPNAFAFLRPNGAFFIVRYGTSTEHPLWSKTAKGWPCASFNYPLDAKSVCRAVNAIWMKNRFTCQKMEQAVEAAKLFGFALPAISERPVNFIIESTGVTVEVEREGKEVVEGWGIAGRKLKRLFELQTARMEHGLDDRYRHLVTPDNEDAGWKARRSDGSWGTEKKDTLRDMMISDGEDETSDLLGRCAKRPWLVVNEPFQPEFLSGRRWNRGRKLLFAPSSDEHLSHPHFDMIFQHLGLGLDEAVAEDSWCNQHGVTSGSQYLMLWAASLFQRPKQPLPYLFLYSPDNNTGKSAFYRALGMLFEGGSVDVHAALTENFNQQLAGAVLCYVEENALPTKAYAKLKAWIDSPTISIREMRMNAYTLPNYAHFVQTANNLDACPIEPRDERIVVVRVGTLQDQIPWTEKMDPALRRKAPDMLATLLRKWMPPAAGRLFLPVLDTPWKQDIMNKSGINVERSDVVSELADAIQKLVARSEHWHGPGGDLLERIGKGPWTNNAGTMVGFLKDAAETLKERGIVMAISPKKVNGYRLIHLGESWMFDPDHSDSDLADDDERTSKLHDALSN